jgi:hypothetical protein
MVGVSSALAGTSLGIPSAPAAPTVSSVGVEQNDYVVIFAPISTGGLVITGYEWESTDGKSGNRSAVGQFTVSQEGGTSQSYRVRAVNAVGVSEWSAYSSSLTTPISPFFPPFFPPSFPFFPSFGGCSGPPPSAWCYCLSSLNMYVC